VTEQSDKHSRPDVVALALGFAELAGTAAVWRKALKAWNMKESPQVLEWQAEARAEARLEKGAEDVRQAIRLRFGMPMPADLQDQLATLKNEADLKRWFDAAVTATSFDTFRVAVQNGRRKRKKAK
jgi:hypothetical protein